MSDENPPATEDAVEGPETAPVPAASDGEPLPVPAPGAPGEAPSASPPAPSTSRWAKARRAVALLLVVIAAAGFVWARESEKFESCDTKVTRSADTPRKVETEENCKPLPPQDLLPLFLLALALLWPDLTSVELFGLGRIVRRLNDQDARQNALETAQQRLENRVETTVSASQNLAITFATDPTAARFLERLVELEGRVGALAPEVARPEVAVTTADGTLQEFLEAFAPIQPWVEVARRLNQPLFVEVLRDGATSGRPSDDPRLVETDKALLRRIERPGQPLDVDALVAWANENVLQIDAVRDTYAAGEAATPESLRVASKFARMLWSDLERRGLVPTE